MQLGTVHMVLSEIGGIQPADVVTVATVGYAHCVQNALLWQAKQFWN